MTNFAIRFSIVCLFATSLYGQAPKTINVGAMPESVCRGFGGHLYVTLINGDEPGDGKIVSVVGDQVKDFAKGMNSPKGIAFVGGYLICSDETVMWKVDEQGKATKLVEAKDFPNTVEFLNDVAAGRDDASVYVSDSSTPTPMFDPSGERKLWDTKSSQASKLPKKGCVYRVGLDGKVKLAVPPGDMSIRFPNGVAVVGSKDKEQLFVGDFFDGNIVQYENSKYEVLATGLRGIDGLTVLEDTFYASSWTSGKVWRVDRKNREAKVLLEGLKSAADFYYDEPNKQLIVPDMLSGTLTFLPVP